MDPTTLSYLLGIAAAMFVGLAKTGVPGVGLPAILLIAEAFPGYEKVSVGAMLPVLLVGDTFAVAFYRQHTQWDQLWRLFPYVLAGMIPGTAVLLWCSHDQFKLILGCLVAGLLVLEICRKRFGWKDVPHRWWFMALMGTLAGFGTTIGNAAGPIMAIYLLSRGLGKEQFMGTWAWFFLIINLSKVPIFTGLGLITFDTLAYDSVIVVGVMIGALLGKRVFGIIPQRIFSPLVLTLAGLAAIKFIGSPFF